jgi:hypothetical protein
LCCPSRRAPEWFGLSPVIWMSWCSQPGSPSCSPTQTHAGVIRIGFILLFAGLVLLVGLLDIGAGPEIVTWPLLLAGAGLGPMASQLGSVTVSAVPD